MSTLTEVDIKKFQDDVWDYYHSNARQMPWRDSTEPYHILVSEVMLQQTQADRVVPKFKEFIDTFPSILLLASSSLSDVLQAWSGLGYNRRAKFLWQSARHIVDNYDGAVPSDHKSLVALPGIGPNTAAAILAYSYNMPVVFIETNIRTIYLHHFFSGQTDLVDDKVILDLVAQTLDNRQPREWYWALMDYGAFLKKTAGSRLSQSRHYKKQSTFEGSHRQMRGLLIKQLLSGQKDIESLRRIVGGDTRFDKAIEGLLKDEIIQVSKSIIRLTDA